MLILLSNGMILNMALLINGRWDVNTEGERCYRLDFLQMPSTLVVMLTDGREIAMVLQWVKNQKGTVRNDLYAGIPAEIAGGVDRR